MINRIEIKMPLPIRVGVFFINLKKKVGFSFDNQAMFNFRENNGFKNDANDKDLKEWHDKNGQNMFFLESLYGAHQSFCMHNKIDLISKEKLMSGISNTKKEDLMRISNVWVRSSEYGTKEIPGKKKAKGSH